MVALDRRVQLAALVVTLAAGFGIARAWPARSNEDLLKELTRQRATIEALAEKVAQGPAEPTRIVARPALDEPGLRDRISQGMREALDERVMEQAKALAAEAEGEAEPTADQLVAFEAASQTLDTSIRAGRWTGEAREQLRARFGALTSEQRGEILRRMASAINSGKLINEAGGAPL